MQIADDGLGYAIPHTQKGCCLLVFRTSMLKHSRKIRLFKAGDEPEDHKDGSNHVPVGKPFFVMHREPNQLDERLKKPDKECLIAVLQTSDV